MVDDHPSGRHGGEQTAGWSGRYAALVERATVLRRPGGMSDAEIEAQQFGVLQLIRLRCDASRIQRTARDIGHEPEPAFTFLLLAKGRATFAHCGHNIELAEGDLTLCSSRAPYELRLDDGSDLLMLRTPVGIAREHLPTPDHFCGRRLAADQGLASTATAMAKSLANQRHGVLDEECRDRAGRHLLGIAASSFVTTIDDLSSVSSIRAGRHLKVKLFIEQHLRDPELSPSLIAERLRLSSRYLRMIFSASNETPSAFILRRRLEECARQLADPRWRGHSITEIAFSWGFNSAPHFTRSLRDRFGTSPRTYRQQQIARTTMPGHGIAARRTAAFHAAAA